MALEFKDSSNLMSITLNVSAFELLLAREYSFLYKTLGFNNVIKFFKQTNHNQY